MEKLTNGEHFLLFVEKFDLKHMILSLINNLIDKLISTFLQKSYISQNLNRIF